MIQVNIFWNEACRPAFVQVGTKQYRDGKMEEETDRACIWLDRPLSTMIG